MVKHSYTKYLTTIAACAVLAACQTTQPTAEEESRSSKINSALERAAHSAAVTGQKNQSLSYLEKIYKRNSSDPDAAVNYARALRESNYLNRAALVLQPFANDPETPAMVKTEYSAVQLAQGNNTGAEEYAQKAILQDPENYRAYHNLGIALDAQGMHKEAERAFRKGLDHWDGDPTTIMNNLALNLASQGFLDEAVEILQKAQAVAPDRLEIERNLRIVMALKQSHGYPIPKPAKKPDSDSIVISE